MDIKCPPHTLQIFSEYFMYPKLSSLAFQQKSYFQKQLHSCFQKLCDVGSFQERKQKLWMHPN